MNKINCDVLILGAGVSGLTAGIYSSRNQLNTIILDTKIAGGQVLNTYEIENYTGYKNIKGYELADKMIEQAKSFGVKIFEIQEIIDINLNGEYKIVKTIDNEFIAKSIIIATGAEPRKLPVENEDKFRGKGIHYCAVCDGSFYKNKDIIVVGGGMSALEESLYLTKFVNSIKIVYRGNKFNVSNNLSNAVNNNSKINVIYNSVIDNVYGDDVINSVSIKNLIDNSIEHLIIDGIFTFIGLNPNTSTFENKIAMKDGYIVTDEDMMTNVGGIFAIGDVRAKKVRQISTAVGDGAISGIMVGRYLDSI